MVRFEILARRKCYVDGAILPSNSLATKKLPPFAGVGDTHDPPPCESQRKHGVLVQQSRRKRKPIGGTLGDRFLHHQKNVQSCQFYVNKLITLRHNIILFL